MSSLAQQLAGITQETQTLALDRKRRSKLHSVSFLYESQHAATQDYESIYTESLEALERLEQLDKRFSKFKRTIFSETSIGTDRQVQSKEQNENLDKTINVFLSLLAPYWHLAISIKASEWPLRRFQMHYHNSEYLLLSTLPYFDQPVFDRVLYVIPKFPTMFQWLSGFKKAGKVPSRHSMIKAFSDVDVFNLYQGFLAKDITNKTQYRRQLVFFVSMAISSLASLSANSSSKLADVVPLILQISGTLLSSKDTESIVSAYTILAVLSSAVPLSRDVILASVETILINLPKNDGNVVLQALTCILKLYQTLQSGALEPLPVSVSQKLPQSLLAADSDYLKLIKSSKFNSKFVCAYLRSMIVNNLPISELILSSLEDFKYFSQTQLKVLLAEVLKKIENKSVEDPDTFVSILKYVIGKDREVFTQTLEQLSIPIDQLEMLLQTTLYDRSSEELQEQGKEFIAVEEETANTDEDLLEAFKAAKSETPSFLYATKVVDEDFLKLQGLYLKSVQQKSTKTFLETCFDNSDSIVSFLLRVATSLNTPIKGRLYALSLLKLSIEQLDTKIHVYTILPILVTLLISHIPKIRFNAGEVLKTMYARPTTRSKKFLLSETIYGEKRSPNIALLSPKDGLALLEKIVNSLSSLELDADQFHKTFSEIVSDKKLGKVTLAFFASHANANNIPSIKMDAMNIVVKSANSIKGTAAPSQLFEHFLERYLTKRSVWIIRCHETGCDFSKFETQVVELVTPKEKNESAIKFLQDSLKSNYQALVDSTATHIINIFPTLKFDFQLKLTNILFDGGLSENEEVISFDALELLESLPLTNEIFIEKLKDSSLSNNSADMPTGAPVAKRRRRSSASTKQAMKEQSVSNLASTHLKKVTMLLDVLEKITSGEFYPSYDLLRLLLNILDDLETLGKDGKLPIFYSQETLASCLTNVISLLQKFKIEGDNSTIRADVVVSAIRSSDSPQVQNKLLLVVASLASLSPELVLHSVMPIFTFMGAHTIRQDDEFSNHVLEQTIQSVVPALVNSSQGDVSEEVEFLLASFASAFLHIPRHRRVALFTSLAKTLGANLSVHLVLFLCSQQYCSAFVKHRMGDYAAIIDFASVFLQKFKPSEQLEAANKFLDLWKEIPEHALTKNSSEFKLLSSRVIFGPSIVALGDEELLSYRKGMLMFIRHALIDLKSSSDIPRLRLKVASQILESEKVEQLLADFASIVEHILSFIDQYHSKGEDEDILDNFYKLLGEILSLLPVEQFVSSITSILTSKKSSLRTKTHVIILTASKFDLEHVDDPYALEGIAELAPILIENISSSKSVELAQASLDTLASLFQRFQDRVDSGLLMKSLGIVTTKHGLLNEESPELVVASINCITSIISIVGVKMIGMFPKIVPPLYSIFAKTKNNDDYSSKLIQISVLILFSNLIKKIPAFLTPNLKDILKIIFDASLVPDELRTSVLNVVVENVDLKTVLNSLCTQWSFVSKLDASSIGLFLSALEQTIDNMEKKQVISQANVFISFLLYSLEYRAESEFDINTVHRIESSIYKCGLQYVMKLNDKSFRPLFASIIRWAFDGEGVTTSISEIERLTSFFKFFNKLQESLRSIITSYYSYLLDNTESLLQRFHSGKLEDINLRRLVLASLSSSFKYDQDEYWQVNARFDSISKALCDQLENVEDNIGKYLVKSLTSLVQATSSSDEHNKRINELLLTHMKAECKPREKFWAIRSLKTIYQKVREAWLSLLPQLVPIIAELLEDDDEDVEMEVRTGLVKVLEEVMGEPLDRYLD